MIGICPKCGELTNLTRHHIYPTRHYNGQYSGDRNILKLCRSCHDDLEKMIPYKKQEHGFYRAIIKVFLNGTTVKITFWGFILYRLFVKFHN